MADQQRIDVIFTGRVQGVFFRATTQDVARRFEVTGWVRNEPNGTVRMVAEGDPMELGRFFDAVQEAKRSNITDVQVTRPPVTGEFTGFEIRR